MENSIQKPRALSYEEAVDIAEDFEDLVGTDFGIPTLKDAEVEYVCVAPYDELNKNMFLAALRLSKDPAATLESYISSGAEDFDVLITGTGVDGQVIYPIRDYAELLNLNYKFPA